MDKYQITRSTYNKMAQAYEDKFMYADLYVDTYDLFCAYIDSPKASILDLACGPGNISKYLLDRYPDFQILGIDSAPNMIALAQKNNPSAQFLVRDCRAIDTLTQQFDAVICGFGLPYLSAEEVEKFIRDAANLLHPKGLLYLSTMEADYQKSGFKSSSSSPADKAYIYYHQAEQLLPLLEKSGFQLLELVRKDYMEADGQITIDLFLMAQLSNS